MVERLRTEGNNVSLLMYGLSIADRGLVRGKNGVKAYYYPLRYELILLAAFFRKVLNAPVYDLLCATIDPFYQFGKRLREIIKRDEIDIIQCEDIWTFAPIRRYVEDIPIYITLHDVASKRFSQRCEFLNTPGIIARIFAHRIEKLERWALKNSTCCVCCSKDDLETYVQQGIPREKLMLISTGVDTRKIYPLGRDAALMSRLGIRPDDLVIFFSGSDSYSHTQAVEDIIHIVLPRLLPSFPQVKMMFAGGICDHIAEKNLKALYPNNIITLGFVDALLKYYGLADVYILPLRYGSGILLKFSEAMAAGKPIISTTIGASGYQIENGKEAIIENDIQKFPGHILHLMKDTGLRKSLSLHARNKALEYDWDYWMAKYSELYTQTSPSWVEKIKDLNPS